MSDTPRISTALLFGRCLAAARRETEATQEQLGGRLKLSRPAIAAIESGRSAPSFWTLFRLGHPVPGEGRQEHTLGALLRVFHAAGRHLQGTGVHVVNRLVKPDEPTIPIERIDRAIAFVLESSRGTAYQLIFDGQGDSEGEADEPEGGA